MNKHKKMKMILCLCLALVMLFSPVMDTAANAAVIAPWVVYALITYMTAMGITFTVTGGVDAMVKAVEDKVDEYEQTVSLPLPFWVIIEEGTKLVPPPSGDPNFNPNRGKFFFTANATAAITAFITWLVSDGGWGAGAEITVTQAIFSANVNGEDTVFTTFDVGNYTVVEDRIYDVNSFGSVLSFNDFNFEEKIFLFNLPNVGNTENTYCLFGIPQDNSTQPFSGFMMQSNKRLYRYTYGNQYGPYILDTIATENNYTLSDFVGIAFFDDATTMEGKSMWFGILTSDNKIIRIAQIASSDKTPINTTVDVMTPEELLELYPPINEGVYLDTSFAAESLEELGELVETVFKETGTMPKPQPQIITDPATQPAPTPVPTPNPSPDFEDVESLGLPALGDALMDKFPFCLPEDLGRLLNIFTAERQTPKWEVDLYQPLHGKIPMQGDTMLTIDLGEYEEIGQITRWASVIGFCLFLLVVTKEFITW